jgi:predicted dehydrogenase
LSVGLHFLECMSNNNCKVAIVGAGNMATEHIRAFQNVQGVTVVGIHSRNRAKAEILAQVYGVMSVCDSVADLFERTRADLVVVAVSELSVNKVCQACFVYPWAALIEKPAGYNLADAQEIDSKARALDRRAFVGFNRRHYSSTRAVLAELSAVTEKRLVHVMDQEDPATAARLGRPAKVVENWMYANSIHMVDYFSMFCRGELQEVNHVVRWNPSNPGIVVAKLQYCSGDVGLYQAIWNAPGPWAVSISTRQKRWEMRPLEQATRQEYLSRELVKLPVEQADLEFKPGIYAQAIEAVRASHGLGANLPTLRDGLATMNIIRQIYEA